MIDLFFSIAEGTFQTRVAQQNCFCIPDMLYFSFIYFLRLPDEEETTELYAEHMIEVTIFQSS